MLAMVVNDDAGCLIPRSALRFFASVLAPTGQSQSQSQSQGQSLLRGIFRYVTPFSSAGGKSPARTLT